MADDEPEDTFDTDTVQANRAAHAGQGVGLKEIQAMRDAGEDNPDIDADDDDDADPEGKTSAQA